MNIQDFKSFLEKNLSLADLEKTSKGGGLRGDFFFACCLSSAADKPSYSKS